LPVIRTLDAATSPSRVFRAIKRRLGLWVEAPAASGELDFTPYERAFTSSEELTGLVPSSMETVCLESRLVLSDFQFGAHLQWCKPLAWSVVALDNWLSRSGRAKWSGNAIFGVFRRVS
jgi:hypothetical protein